jgi:hypothetical protein
MGNLLIFLVSLMVAIGRFGVPGHGLSLAGSYEAFAHIWVGALLVLAWQARVRWNAILCLVMITALEGAMFLLR